MQKVINVLAVSSFAVSAAIIGAAGYVFVNQDAIVAGIKDQAASITKRAGASKADHRAKS